MDEGKKKSGDKGEKRKYFSKGQNKEKMLKNKGRKNGIWMGNKSGMGAKKECTIKKRRWGGGEEGKRKKTNNARKRSGMSDLEEQDG